MNTDTNRARPKRDSKIDWHACKMSMKNFENPKEQQQHGNNTHSSQHTIHNVQDYGWRMNLGGLERWSAAGKTCY